MSAQAITESTGSTGGIWDDPGVVGLVTAAAPGWRVLKLQEVCTRITDGTHKTPRYQSEGVRFISIKNIRPFQPINWEAYERYISLDEHQQLTKRCKPEVDDIIFPRIGTLGFAKRIDFSNEVSIFVGLGLLKPNKNLVQPKFLEYWMNHPLIARLSRERASGSGRLTLPLEQSREFPVLVPPLRDQGRIVEDIEKQFSRLDEAVNNLKRVNASLKRYKTAVLQAATRGDFTAKSASASNGNLPPQWHWFTVEQLASHEARSIQSGPFGSNLKHSEFQGTGHLVIGIDNVQDGRFSIGANHRISETKFKELSKYAARPGDVLITVMATIGRVCVVPDQIEPSIITKHVYRITVNRELAAPEYLAIALRGASKVRAQLLGSVQGQTRPGLNGTLIKQIRIPTPPVEEQHRIVTEVDRRLSLVRELGAEVEANLKRAEALRRATLRRAFATDGFRARA